MRTSLSHVVTNSRLNVSLTLTPTNCSCKMTHDKRYAQATLVANNAIASVANSARNDRAYRYVVSCHSKQNVKHRFRNRPANKKKNRFNDDIKYIYIIGYAPAVNPRSRRPRNTSPNISLGLSHFLTAIRPNRYTGKNNIAKFVQNHDAKNGALNPVVTVVVLEI